MYFHNFGLFSSNKWLHCKNCTFFWKLELFNTFFKFGKLKVIFEKDLYLKKRHISKKESWHTYPIVWKRRATDADQRHINRSSNEINDFKSHLHPWYTLGTNHRYQFQQNCIDSPFSKTLVTWTEPKWTNLNGRGFECEITEIRVKRIWEREVWTMKDEDPSRFGIKHHLKVKL